MINAADIWNEELFEAIERGRWTIVRLRSMSRTAGEACRFAAPKMPATKL